MGKRHLGVLPGLREAGELMGVQRSWEVAAKPLPRAREVHGLYRWFMSAGWGFPF